MNISIQNLTIQNGRNTAGSIYLTNSSSISFDRINFLNNTANDGSGVDIFLDNTGGSISKMEVSFCKTIGCGTFAYLNNTSTTIWFLNCTVLQPIGQVFIGDVTNGGSGFFNNIYFQTASKSLFYGYFLYTRIANCISYYVSQSSTQYQLDFTSNSQSILISGNHFSTGGNGGLRLTNSQIIQIVGNNISAGTMGDGINVNSATSQNIEIVGNSIGVTTSRGIHLSNINYGMISNNVISSNDFAISLGTTNYVTITGNTISTNASGKDGINFINASESPITGNWINSGVGSTYGVNLDANSNNNVVVANRIRFGSAATLNNGSGNVIANNA
jgi:parallel beta-helix repeat protein